MLNPLMTGQSSLGDAVERGGIVPRCLEQSMHGKLPHGWHEAENSRYYTEPGWLSKPPHRQMVIDHMRTSHLAHLRIAPHAIFVNGLDDFITRCCTRKFPDLIKSTSQKVVEN